jgi:hypothetical protein
MVGTRRRLLNYLKQNDLATYRTLIDALGTPTLTRYQGPGASRPASRDALDAFGCFSPERIEL